jgi:pyruvate,water dikinase
MNTMRWILFPGDPPDGSAMGGKAASLAVLGRARLPIPAWFVIRGEACLESLGEEKRTQLAGETDPAFVAVRSSAADEDGAEHSFAGQLESYLFVSQEALFEKIAAVWQSGFSPRILAYRQQRGLAIIPRPPAVLVQQMVDADAAGVAFSADPVSGRRGVAVVSAVPGLGIALVSGEANADTWHIDRTGKILETQLAEKTHVHRPDPGSSEGSRIEILARADGMLPVLAQEQAVAVAGLARACASHFGRPQDIEWAASKGRIYLLQSRPITSLASQADPDGIQNIWDNSNIAESYGGITTPLTYSFARRAYEEVYRQFCRLMAVPGARIAANSQVFRCMIGLVRGRVYYNLLNWYRVLALLPGFTVNRHFMEQMMGVKEPLPKQLLGNLENASTADRIRDGLNLAGAVAGLLWNHFTLRKQIRDFYARLEEALRPPAPPLEEARPDELATAYLELESRLLTRWDAPLVNDFFAMIFYGVLKKLVTKWCRDSDGTLQNNLLCGEGGIVSAEPAKRIVEMAAIAAKYPGLPEKLANAPIEDILSGLEDYPDFETAYRAYLEKFGDRCLDELKLESSTLHDDPATLLRSIGQLAARGPVAPRTNPEAQMREQAEARCAEKLKGSRFRSIIFGWVLDQTRSRVRDRENLRFERTRLFGRVRRIFVAFGRNFHALDLLKFPGEVFYLEGDEILGFCDGTTTTTDLKGLVAIRRAEFERHRTAETPADRFETRGAVNQGNSFQRSKPAAPEPAGTEGVWKGIGCCPGVVRGRVRVVTDPRNAFLNPGEILVAERTDPGWIMLFASAAGILVERGSLLSHSAIVSREMGLPSIVSIPRITNELADGDWIEMDGAAGTVKRVSP